jgi:hypothetical protein
MRLIDADALAERIGNLKHEIASRSAGWVDDESYECGAVDALYDALNYIKEAETVPQPEPHVLTWDEMVEAGKNHVGVYVEEYPNANRTDRWAIVIEGIEPPEHGYNYPGGTMFNAVDADDDMYDGDLYGLNSVLGWRAWSAKPTEEQMKSTPWEWILAKGDKGK